MPDIVHIKNQAASVWFVMGNISAHTESSKETQAAALGVGGGLVYRRVS